MRENNKFELPVLMQMNEMLDRQIADPLVLLEVLLKSLPPELCSQVGFVQLHQVSGNVTTRPPLQAICLECSLLDHAGYTLTNEGIWYLTSHSWHESFVATYAAVGSNVASLQAETESRHAR